MPLKTELRIKAIVEGFDEIKKLGASIKETFSGAANSSSMATKSFGGLRKEVQNLQRAQERLKGLSSELNKFGQGAKSAGKSLSLFVTGPLLALGGFSLSSAIDAEETQNKFNEIFKGIEDQSAASAQNLRDNFGLALSEAQGLLAGTGDILTGVGFDEKSALDFSAAVQEASVDLASFKNVQGGAQQVSESITKALLGERESLKSLGIALSENDVKSRVLENARKGLVFETERQAKAQATLDLILERSSKAQGDFARTSDGAANQQRIFTSRLQEVKEFIGSQLIPIYNELLGIGLQVIDFFQSLPAPVQRFGVVIAAAVAAIGPLLIVLGQMATGLGSVASILGGGGLVRMVLFVKNVNLATVAVKAFSFALKALKLGAIIAAVVAVGTAMKDVFAVFQNGGGFILGLQTFIVSLQVQFLKLGRTIVDTLAKVPIIGDRFKGISDGFTERITELETALRNNTRSEESFFKEAEANVKKSEKVKTEVVKKESSERFNALKKQEEEQAKALAKAAEEARKIAEAQLQADRGIAGAVQQGAELGNRENLADAALNGADEQELAAIRVQGLQDYRDTLESLITIQNEFVESTSDPEGAQKLVELKEKLVGVRSEIALINQTPLQLDQQNLAANVDKINTSLNNVPSLATSATGAFATFSDQANKGFENLVLSGLNGITGAFTSIIDGTKSASEAFSQFAKNVLKQLAQIAIQKAITAAIGSAFSTGGAVGGGAQSFNTGGKVTGPGNGTSDSIPAWLSNGEFVLRTKAVESLGVPLLNVLNRFGVEGLDKIMSKGINQKFDNVRSITSARKVGRSLKFEEGGVVNGSPQQGQMMPNLTLNIQNNSQTDVQPRVEGPSLDEQLRSSVYTIILDDAAVGGPISRSIRGGR